MILEFADNSRFDLKIIVLIVPILGILGTLGTDR
jgi:hypothetical protein